MICYKGDHIDELMHVSGYRAEFTYGLYGTSSSRRRGLEVIDVEFMEIEQFLRGSRLCLDEAD